MIAITLKESFSDKLTRTLLLYTEFVYSYVKLTFVKSMVKRLAYKSRAQFSQTLSRVEFFKNISIPSLMLIALNSIHRW